MKNNRTKLPISILLLLVVVFNTYSVKENLTAKNTELLGAVDTNILIATEQNFVTALDDAFTPVTLLWAVGAMVLRTSPTWTEAASSGTPTALRELNYNLLQEKHSEYLSLNRKELLYQKLL